MKQTFSGEIESAGVALAVAASSAGDALAFGTACAHGSFSLLLLVKVTPRGGRDVEIGQVRSRPIQLPPTFT
jgi:hypothetical protein